MFSTLFFAIIFLGDIMIDLKLFLAYILFINLLAFAIVGYDKYLASEVTFIPDNYITLDEEGTEKVMTLIEALEDLDDVQNVYHNLDI